MKPQVEAVEVENLSVERADQSEYTLGDVAKYLNTNESTLRNWERRFGDFLGNFRNGQGHRLFTESDVATLERIKNLMESGLFTMAGVRHMLTSGNLTPQDGQTQTALAMRSEEELKIEKEYREKLLFALNSLGSEMSQLRKEVREDLKMSLQTDINHLKLLLEPPVQPRPWWKLW